MRKPEHLSYSSLSLWYKDRDEFFIRYLSDTKAPRLPQEDYMSIGSAFDAYAKSALHEAIFGQGADPQFEFDAIFTDQVEEHNRDWAREHGRYVFDCYVHTGAYAELLAMLLNSREEPRFEFTVNAKWSFAMGMIVHDLLREHKGLEAKPCVQTFTFGQHRHNDLGNNHRPLLRLKRDDAPLYPDSVRVPSWRQLNGDKRADPRGRVPGDVFDVPRVTGNSKQRRRWHPTQLNEELVERCVKLSTLEGERVIDPFAGTGTTLRVCGRIRRHCTLIECDHTYCDRIAAEHNLKPQGTHATVFIST